MRKLFILMILVIAVSCSGNKKTTPKADANSCKNYAEVLCKETGPTSSSCQSIKTAAEILPPQACVEAMANLDYTKKQIKAQRAKCDELVTKLCSDLGPETKTCAMVKAKTGNFPPEQCTRMMAEYPKVLAELKKMENANKPLDAEKRALIEKGKVPSFGPEDAKVTIVEFSDFECPYCSRSAKVASQIKVKYSSKVRFVFRNYPLSFHKNANIAAQASLAADAQGKFWPFHDIMFENQKKLDRDSLNGYAKQLGLDVEKFKKALDEGVFTQQIKTDMEIANKVAVSGTPTMFLNGERVANPTDFNAISSKIEKILKTSN